MRRKQTSRQLACLLGLIVCAIGETTRADEPLPQENGLPVAVGPDVIVSEMPGSPVTFGYVDTGSGPVTGLSFGAEFCNVGDAALRYESFPSTYHPLFRGSMFRLNDGRFEQIGISWVYHGFFAVNEPGCDPVCTAPGNHGGTLLYPGCSDGHLAYIIGDRSFLSPASAINAHTGGFSLPVIHPPTSSLISGRIQVHNEDLDPALNPNASYYTEGQTLAQDDAASGNGNNNASYERVSIVSAAAFPNDSCTGSDPQKFCATFTDSFHPTEPAIRAWKNEDPAVVETDAQIPGEGLFVLAARVTDLGTGYWRYEYALQNVNSDRSGRAFTLPLPPCGAIVTNVGFHDVDYHSGGPYSGADWESNVVNATIRWSTEDFDTNPDANALRWGTLYNFRFESNAPPGSTLATLELFKLGSPAEIAIRTIGPMIDSDGDGNFDLADFSEFLQCFTGDSDELPPSTCQMRFDYDENDVIDLADFRSLSLTGPLSPFP